MQADKVRWWPIYREPDHELVGKIQLYILYSTSADDNSNLKVSIYEPLVVFLIYKLMAESIESCNLFLNHNYSVMET